MSRMDRYKDIHKKAKPLKRDTGSILLEENENERVWKMRKMLPVFMKESSIHLNI